MKRWRRFRIRLRNALLGWRCLGEPAAIVPQKYAPRYNREGGSSGWDQDLNFVRNEDVLVIHLPVSRALLSCGDKKAVVKTVTEHVAKMAEWATWSRVELGC